MRRLSRRDFVKGGLALAAASVAVPVALASERLELERREIVLPDLHPAHDGLRLAQLSDVHVGPLTSGDLVREAVRMVNHLAPDLVALTGDYLSQDRSGVGLVGELLAGLEAPAVAVLGNHDHRVDRDGAVGALERLGYCVLRNENTVLRLRGEPLTVVGIDDLTTGHADPARALEGAAPGSRLHLTHNPLAADALRRTGRPLLVLAGHTHGGQVNLPLLSGALEPYKSGLYRLGAVQLYVNRGLGNTWIPVRLNARPEVTLLTLRSGQLRPERPPA